MKADAGQAQGTVEGDQPVEATVANGGVPCPNCAAQGTGNYCSQCGQRRGATMVSLRRLITDAIEDQFSLNSALPRTFGKLIFKPGHLTTEYTRGRIARYLPPFRLYLICSFLFFLALQFTGGEGAGFALNMSDDANPQAENAAAEQAPAAPGIAENVAVGDSVAAEEAVSDSLKADEGIDEIFTSLPFLPERLRQPMKQRVRYVVAAQHEDENAVGRAISRELQSRAPVAMFLLIPLYALLLAVLYYRKRRFYVEHFIFALHVHSFAFLTFAVLLLIDQFVIELVLTVWILIYSLLALRHVYRQGWFRTVVKYAVLNFVYSTFMGLTMLAIALVALLLAPL